MNLKDVEISPEEARNLRVWLRAFYKLEANLTNVKIFPQHQIKKLIKIEAEERKRSTVIDRLLARYFKLEKIRCRKMINEYMGKEGKCESMK